LVTPICLAAGAPLLLAHPWLVWVIAGYGALFAITLQQARNRHERSMTNNLVLIVECSLLVPVVAGVVGDEQGISVPVDAMTAAPVVAATAAVLLPLAGSTLHVKSLIRERNNPAYARASVAVAFAAPLELAGLVAVAVGGVVAL
jgi:hypothetical protein